MPTSSSKRSSRTCRSRSTFSGASSRSCRSDAILASNTSYLDLDQIAAATRRPGDVVGLHFFSPAHVMRLLEIVRGAQTSADTLATALAVAKKLRKLPVVARVGEGFIGNRIYAAYRTAVRVHAGRRRVCPRTSTRR